MDHFKIILNNNITLVQALLITNIHSVIIYFNAKETNK